MCECGCIMNADLYTLLGPGKSFYLVSLMAECLNCDASPGITIELIEPGHHLYDEYRRGEPYAIPLKLEQWPDTKGAAIVTGHRRHEFVAAVKKHLEGLEVKHFTEAGRIDRIGAETILEEMYEDSQVKPQLPKRPATPAESQQ